MFPTGKADFNDSSRSEKVTFRDWAKFLIQYKDGRFARDPRFRYLCLNTLQRHEVITQGSLYANMTNFNGTVNELQQRLVNEPSLIKRFMHFGSNTRGSNSYWYQRQTELKAMVNQLGIPTIFLTLSAADLWWPCLVKHFKLDVNELSE